MGVPTTILLKLAPSNTLESFVGHMEHMADDVHNYTMEVGNVACVVCD